MLWDWFKRRRRRRILSQAFPSGWKGWLEEHVLQYRRVPPELQLRLLDLTQVFIAEKNWEGCEGFEVTDEVRVTIAALASLLVLGRPDELNFDHVLSILVFPDIYRARLKQQNAAGVVIERREARAGEAWYRGPVILSWEDVLADARGEFRGDNVVLHEFAHQLDMAGSGSVDGTPRLPSRDAYERWGRVMQAAFRHLRERCRQGRPGLLDCYGAKDPAEFFAVITETFFERPLAMRTQLPEVYELLEEFYGLDPSAWSWGE